MKLQRSFAAKFAVLALAAASSTAFASGSMSPSNSQNADAYSIGKSIFFKQVACDSCAYAFMAKSTKDVKSVFTALNGQESKIKLSEDELEAVNVYLTKRFNLTTTAGK
jgi:exo-beta-1,3-glucanase (GH17 family)